MMRFSSSSSTGCASSDAGMLGAPKTVVESPARRSDTSNVPASFGARNPRRAEPIARWYRGPYASSASRAAASSRPLRVHPGQANAEANVRVFAVSRATATAVGFSLSAVVTMKRMITTGTGDQPARGTRLGRTLCSRKSEGANVKDFNGKIAVITGGGTGMGRELARQLVAEGASVAICDVLADNMAETKRICEADGLPQGVRVTTHVADVADEAAMVRFAAEVARDHETDKINLLFNNAGIGGGASFINAPREEWDRVFNICWNGVYFGCRAFMPMLLKSEEGAVVNTSSANGFWAALMPNVTHTAYSAAKFAVKGFTEALINDFRNNAPHLKAHIVMPGGVGTPIGLNSRRVLLGDNVPLSEDEKTQMRQRFAAMGIRGRRGNGRARAARSPEVDAQALRDDGADYGGQSGEDHPRRCEGRSLAHTGGRRRHAPG